MGPYTYGFRMLKDRLNNTNVVSERVLISPGDLKRHMPNTARGEETVSKGRETIRNILGRQDHRLLVVVGPCSIHDLDAATDYAKRLAELRQELDDTLFIVMRIYFEKPRTTVGWKGLVNDPHMNDTFDIESGLTLARSFLLELVESGMPAATEALDPIVPQYFGDLISWYAIGARTTESQTHREMASGLSAPCGFKNATDGNVQVAVQAMQAARSPHAFLGIDGDGRTAVVRTRGNPDLHAILRGGREPNYDAAAVEACIAALGAAGLPPAVVVDCSHGNSAKDAARQPGVAREVVAQRAAGQGALIGIMLESNLEFGNQALGDDVSQLRYGVSITDACIDWETTAALLRDIHAALG